MTDFRLAIRVEELDARELPSAAPVAPVVTEAHTAPANPPRELGPRALAGWIAGDFAVRPAIPDTGERIDLVGNGRLAETGRVTVTGHLTGVGMVWHGHATGTLTIRTAHGALTLELTGPEQGGFAKLPGTWHYTIVAGTGAYAHTHGHGTLHLGLALSHPTPGTPAHGTFVMWV
jgi:hypothetical protein